MIYLDILRKTAKIKKDNAEGKSSISKTIQELKLVIDQQRIDSEKSSKREKNNNAGNDPLARFFTDEISTTKQLLRAVRADLESLRNSDDLKVKKNP